MKFKKIILQILLVGMFSLNSYGTVIVTNNTPGHKKLVSIGMHVFNNGVCTSSTIIDVVVLFGQTISFHDNTQGQIDFIYHQDSISTVLDPDTFNSADLSGPGSLSTGANGSLEVPIYGGVSRSLSIKDSAGNLINSGSIKWRIWLPGGSYLDVTGSVYDLANILGSNEHYTFQISVGFGDDFTLPFTVKLFKPIIQYSNSDFSGWADVFPTSLSGATVATYEDRNISFRVKPNPVVDGMSSSAFSWSGSHSNSSGNGKTRSNIKFTDSSNTTGTTTFLQHLRVHGSVAAGGPVGSVHFKSGQVSEWNFFLSNIHLVPQAITVGGAENNALFIKDGEARVFANTAYSGDNGLDGTKANAAQHSYASGRFEMLWGINNARAAMESHEYSNFTSNAKAGSTLMDMINNEHGFTTYFSGMTVSALETALTNTINNGNMEVLNGRGISEVNGVDWILVDSDSY